MSGISFSSHSRAAQADTFFNSTGIHSGSFVMSKCFASFMNRIRSGDATFHWWNPCAMPMPFGSAMTPTFGCTSMMHFAVSGSMACPARCRTFSSSSMGMLPFFSCQRRNGPVYLLEPVMLGMSDAPMVFRRPSSHSLRVCSGVSPTMRARILSACTSSHSRSSASVGSRMPFWMFIRRAGPFRSCCRRSRSASR